jgi:hypothetical protein
MFAWNAFFSNGKSPALANSAKKTHQLMIIFHFPASLEAARIELGESNSRPTANLFVLSGRNAEKGTQ